MCFFRCSFATMQDRLNIKRKKYYAIPQTVYNIFPFIFVNSSGTISLVMCRSIINIIYMWHIIRWEKKSRIIYFTIHLVKSAGWISESCMLDNKEFRLGNLFSEATTGVMKKKYKKVKIAWTHTPQTVCAIMEISRSTLSALIRFAKPLTVVYVSLLALICRLKCVAKF